MPTESSNDYQAWPADLLASYIERIHHIYVREQSTDISEFLNKLCKVHGRQHPELLTIRSLFLEGVSELAMHMQKEEMILFPRIRKMVQAQLDKQTPGPATFGTVQNPIRMMMHEHDAEGERFRQIARLSNDYTPPADACNTYKVTYALLREFEDNLHLHVHLENNILFPKAIALEEQLDRPV
jgi:regulator of cell morphogenesis and NO signaling